MNYTNIGFKATTGVANLHKGHEFCPSPTLSPVILSAAKNLMGQVRFFKAREILRCAQNDNRDICLFFRSII